MMTHGFDQDDDGDDPIAMLTSYCEAQGWTHEMVGEEELVTSAPGSWSQYELRAVWREEDGILQLMLFPDIRVTDERRAATYETLSLINENMWMGHFELWSNPGILAWRHATLIGIERGITMAMTEQLLRVAIEECDRFYPAFQFMLWGNKSPAEAIAAAMVETQGEA